MVKTAGGDPPAWVRSILGGLPKRWADHLALVEAFAEKKRSEAVEPIAIRELGSDAVDAHRTPGKEVRTVRLALALYVLDPRLLVQVRILDHHLGRRATWHRISPLGRLPARLETGVWEPAVEKLLCEWKVQRHATFGRYDEAVVFPLDKPDGLVVALREWAHDVAGRSASGKVDVVTVPTWTVLHFGEDGQRLDVTDGMVDRGAQYAAALVQAVTSAKRQYEIIEDPVNRDVLGEFLSLITDAKRTPYPLIELVAEVPWRAHRLITVTGQGGISTEDLVADLRRLGSFALDWSTVRHVKLLFDGKYKIQVHFPARSEQPILTFSDVDRKKSATRRFVDDLAQHVGVMIAPKVKRGTTRPNRPPTPPPRKFSRPWWDAVLASRADDPPDWLNEAWAQQEVAPLVRLVRTRVFACGSPFVDRRAVGVDSLDCTGEVHLPEHEDDWEEQVRVDADAEIFCDASSPHVWRPTGYRLPTSLRARVEPIHDALWERVLRKVREYGEVRTPAGSTGVAILYGSRLTVQLVYLPLATDPEDLDPGRNTARNPIVWIAGPTEVSTPQTLRTVPLAMVLHDPGEALLSSLPEGSRLAKVGAGSTVDERPMVVGESETRWGPITIVLAEDGAHVDGRLVWRRERLGFEILVALSKACALDTVANRERLRRSRDELCALVGNIEVSDSAWQTRVSRLRTAIRDAVGEKRIEPIPSSRDGYVLAENFSILDRWSKRASDG